MSHGDHWQALFGADFSGRLAKLLPRLVQQGSLVRHVAHREVSAGSEQERWPYFALEYGEMPLRCLTVIHIDPEDRLNKVRTAYPLLTEGKPVELEITDKTQNDEFEAALQCVTRKGTPLTFFAPFYGVDPSAFETGRKYEFSLAALAYSLKKSEKTEFTLTEEPALEIEKLCRQEEDPNAAVADVTAVDFSFAGLRALLFHADNAADAEFYTAVESVSYFSFEETEMCRMDVRFLLREGDELRTALYASEHVLVGYRPEVGDLIHGDLWLQGYPVKPIDEDESWGTRSREDTALQNFLFSDEYLSGLHVGVTALARSLMYGGWDLRLYKNDGDNPAIPAYLIERDNRRINVWVRSYIEGQEPETVFTAEETASFQKESRENGCEAACAVVLCKDVGKGYTFKILEREELEKTLGSFSGLMLYQQKILPEERSVDEAREIPPPGEEAHEGHTAREKLPMIIAEEGPEEFYQTFRALSYNGLWAKLSEIRGQRQGDRRVEEYHEQELSAALAKTQRISHPEKRRRLALAKSVYEVDFIAKAKPGFWQWLEKVRQCPHIHLDMTPGSHAELEPFYNCRWCGATVACSCRYPEGSTISGISDHWARRESTYNDLFRDIFVRPGICYRCRRDESLGVAYNYGKDRLERLLWRELFHETRHVQSEIRQPDYDAVDQIIRASSRRSSRWEFASVVLTRDASSVIRRALERALRIKKILRKAGHQETIKTILVDFVKSYCRLHKSINNLHALEDELLDDDGDPFDYVDTTPYTLHLPSSYGNQAMWRSYDLERHPEKALDLPYPFQLALLVEFIEEGPEPIHCDARKMAKVRLLPLLDNYDAVHDFGWAMEAVKCQDIGLFLKMLVLAWEKDQTVLESRRDEIQRNLEKHRMFWAIWEYDLHVSGKYSGLEKSVKKDAGLRKWLLSSFELPGLDTFLKNGDIVTNVVGMSHIPWHAYLDLDLYVGKGGFYLLREPDNTYDHNAIMVYLEGFGKTGYLKRPLAAMLVPLMDRGMEIEAELFARHYPYYDLDMTLHLRLKQATTTMKPPDRTKKYRKRPQKKQKFVVVKQDSGQERTLKTAKASLDDARRWLEKDIGHDRIPDKLHTTVMDAMKAWLYGQSIKPNMGNGWHSMKSQFMETAPDQLRLRVKNALVKSASLEGNVGGVNVGYARQGKHESGRRRWRWDVTVAIKQIGTLIRLMEAFA